MELTYVARAPSSGKRRKHQQIRMVKPHVIAVCFAVLGWASLETQALVGDQRDLCDAGGVHSPARTGMEIDSREGVCRGRLPWVSV